MVDFALTDEQRQLQETARKFAYEEPLPASVELDRKSDPSECYPRDLIEQASRLGLRTLTLPREYGGLEASCVTQVVVLEELCTADTGFGMTIQHAWREGKVLASYTTDDQRERYLHDFLDDHGYLTAFANTEDHWGSDGSGDSQDPADGPLTTAVLDGDEWVINGRKRWISNANVARMALILVRTDTTVPWRRGVSFLLVPTDSPGYGIGRVEDKLGIRLNQNAEIVLEDCRVPKGNLLGELNEGAKFRAMVTPGSKAKTATKALGVARAAFEEAVAYTRKRVQGGKPIIEHQAVAAELVKMETSIEATRALIYRAAWMVDNKLPNASRFEAMAKSHAAEVAAEVAMSALDLHGANGVDKANRIEKLLRDAATTQHIGTASHAARAVLGRALAKQEAVTGFGL